MKSKVKKQKSKKSNMMQFATFNSLKNYFKTAWHSLIKDKLHSFVNVRGYGYNDCKQNKMLN